MKESPAEKKDTKTVIVPFRASEAEKARLVQMAIEKAKRDKKIASVSDTIRELIFGKSE